jgi:asparagine synthase (glutamine-hydrolysing)
MPGIAGVIKRGAARDDANVVPAMIKGMVHEDFDRSGTYSNDDLGLRAGWVCQQGSFSDGLPVWNENRDICLIFSGEDAQDPSVLGRLRDRGHDCALDNASYLVHLYEEEGPAFLLRLNGGFSGILADLRERKVLLFNDRYGLGRIYYHESEAGLYFSSEAKSLLKIRPDLRRFDEAGLGELFSCGSALENRSLFAGISLAPPGSLWTFSPSGTASKEAYFRPGLWEDQSPLSPGDFSASLRSTFARAVARLARPGDRAAVSLTGGIDTRMIMAWAAFPPYKVPCYTFGGMYRECADVRIARRVAMVCQQRHTVIKVARKFFSEFPALAKRTVTYTDGAMDVSGAVELYVNKLAREIAPIRLTGNYGDQVIRRVVGFRPFVLDGRIFSGDFAPHVRAGFRTYERIERAPELSFFAFKQVPWHHFSRLALERTQLTMRSPFLDNDLVGLMYRAPSGAATSVDGSLRLIAAGFPALARIPTDRGRRVRGLPGWTQARHLWQELVFKAEYAFDYGMPPWLSRLDHRLSGLNLGRAFIGRHKFYHYRQWYKNELSKYVQDILLDPKTLRRPYLDAAGVEAIVSEHMTGRANHTLEIHQLLTSELAHRHLIESI